MSGSQSEPNWRVATAGTPIISAPWRIRLPSRSEAIRRLIEIALTVNTKKHTGKK